MISELNKLGIALKALDVMNLATVGINTGNVDAFRSAIKGLSTEQAVFALASKGATEEQIRQILITKQSEAADVEAVLAKAGLTSATSALTQAEMVELATKTGVAKADAESLLSKIGITAAEEGQVAVKHQVTMAMLEQAVANGTLTSAESAQIATMLGLNAVETANIGITNILTGAVAKLWAVITAHPIGAILTAVGAVAVGVIAYINKSNKDAQKAIVETHEKAKQALDDAKTALSDDKSELESVNSELDSTKQKIQDIASQGTITLTEQNELDKLSTANTQLETQKSLLENNIKLKQKSAALDAKNLLDTQVEMNYSYIQDDKDIVSHKESYNYAKHAEYEASSLKNAYNIYMRALKTGNAEKQKLAQELIDKAGGNTAELTSSLLEIVESFKYDDGTIIEGYEDLYNQYMGLIYNLQSLTNPEMFLDIAKQATEGTNIDYEKAISDGYAMAYDGEFDIDKLNQDFVKALADNGIDESTIEYIFKLKQQEYQSVVDNINKKYNPDNVLKPTYLTESGHTDTKEQTAQKELDNQNYEQQKQEVQNINDELTKYAKEHPIEFQLISSYDENFSTLDKYIEEEKSKSESAIQDTKSQLEDLSKNGNVDLTIRPVIDSSAMQAAGWDVEDGSIATTFTQGEFIWQGDEENGQYVYVHYTPILPDGTVLTPDQLSDYLYGTLEGSQNILDADDKGLVLKVDTDLQGISEDDIKALQEDGKQSAKMSNFLNQMGQWDDSLHDVQEGYYLTGDSVDYVDNAVNRLVEDAKKAKGEISEEIPISNIRDAWNQMLNSTDSDTQKAAEALQTLADKGELTIKTFSETDGAKNYFDGLNVSAEEAVKYINSLSDKNSQLGAMSKNIKSITDALGTKASDGLVSVDDLSGFDATIKGLSTWEKFSTLLGDASSSMEDCQKIANELATEYVNSESVLSNLNETNRAYYESQLDNMGVTNSAAVVEAALAKNLGEEKIATEEAIKAGLSLHGTKIDTTNATELFSNATAGEIIQLANEANQSGVSSQALALLAVKKLNNPTLTTDGDIKNLMDLCKGLDLATEAIKTFQSIKNNVMNPDGSIKASGSSEKIAKENALNTAYEKMKSIIKTSVSGASVNSHGTSGGGTSSGGGGGSSTTKTPFDYLTDYAGTFFDWIEVRLDRLQKKIDSNISKAESKLNDKRYSSATANYMSAINVTYDKINDTKAGRDEYIKYANNYINKAISLKAINKNLAEEIKSRVADGSINISEYNSDIQTVISTYKDWIDKAKDCTTAIQTLHDSLRTYAEDLKKVSDAQRDATVSMAETKQTIATGGVQNTISAKNTALNYNNIVLNTKNKAYSTATKSAASNVNQLAGSANSALNKGKVKDNAKYNTTLKNIKKYIKKRAIIPDSLLGIVAKRNTSLYNRLYMYNLGIENLKTAREEYTTAYAANNAEKYNNIAEKYKNLDDATNDEMDYNSSISDNSVYAKNKNKYLNKKSSGYTQMYYRDVSEANVYGALTRKAKAQIKNPSRKSLGTSYSSLSTKMMKAVRSCISSARKSVSHNKVISSSIIARLTEYVKKGYVSQSFLNSCISYNNALESYNQAKTQAAIDKQTQIAQRAEIASQKFSNISTEYDNKRHKYDQASTELNNKMSTLEAKGNGASANWYKRLKGNETLNNTSLIQKRQSLITSLNNSVKTGAIKKYSTEWYELRSQIDDVTNAIDESKKALAEYDNQINQIHWDRIDELVQKRQNLIDESDFMINELSRRDLTSDDTGGLTAEGNAVAGLHVANYKAYKASATTYANEIASINKKLAKDPYNQTLIEQKEKLVKSYQDCVKGAQDEKFATIDLIKSGYDALSNKIKNLISDYEDLLDKQSDAYSYSESINEKTKTLSDLRKQLVAISGDTSEETRAKKQELNQSLKDAEKDLKDTQYDKLISSTKDMLSDFQTDLDDSIQDIIKSLDDNFTNLVSEIDSKWDDSNDAITKLMESIQYESSKQFEMVTSDGKVSQNTYNAISNIYEFMQKAWTKYDTDAKESQRYTVPDANPSGSKTDPQIKGLNTKTGLGEFKHGKVSPPETLGSFGKGKILSSSTKKEIEAFLAKNLVKAKNKYENYGVLNKKMYKAYNGKVLPISKWTELAKMIGFDNYSPNTNSAFYQTLRMSGIKGFKKGSDSIPYDMIANLGENGTELQYDVSKGVLKSVGQGDMIFTAEEAKTLMEFAKNPMAYKNMYTGTAFSMPSVPVNNKVDNDVNISIGDIKLEGVQDPKQLANGIKDVIKNNTGGVRSMIKEDTIGTLDKRYNSLSVKRW